MVYGYEDTHDCPVCQTEVITKDWIDGECPICHNTYTWEDWEDWDITAIIWKKYLTFRNQNV